MARAKNGAGQQAKAKPRRERGTATKRAKGKRTASERLAEKRPPGRPPVLAWGQDVPDPEHPGKTKRIPGPMDLYVAALEAGNTVVDAAELAGVGKSTVYEALRRGRADKRAGVDSPERLFLDATRTAKAKAKAVLVGRVFAASRSHWRAAIAMLERRYPKEWGLQRLVRHGLDPEGAKKGGKMTFTLDFGPGPRPRDAEGNLLDPPGGSEG